jgi:UDP-N-acetyl-D-galactosamine dehydrogenase
MSDITVVGLGYVGLPLAVALSHHHKNVKGFDIDTGRVQELHMGHDRTGEIDSAALRSSTLKITANLEDIRGSQVYIVTVPTPVNANNEPDLSPLQRASEMIGSILKAGAIVVYESTVYPGVTEKVCGRLLEQKSGLRCGHDFFLGYSPERINPGDREHTIDQIVKVISGQTPEVVEVLRRLYGAINHQRIFVAASIQTAEAAKVIENAQRDLNIAFMNELALIFSRMNLSIYDVLDAAETKWNFLRFSPGLVGGHCIGVDPYYLATAARQLGIEPHVILSGRRVNEAMASEIAEMIHHAIPPSAPKTALILGLTFKENIPDLRNTKVVDLIQHLQRLGYTTVVHDPLADPDEAKALYQIDLVTSLDAIQQPFGVVVGAVPHAGYQHLLSSFFQNCVHQHGLIADLKRMWAHETIPTHLKYWSL